MAKKNVEFYEYANILLNLRFYSTEFYDYQSTSTYEATLRNLLIKLSEQKKLDVKGLEQTRNDLNKFYAAVARKTQELHREKHQDSLDDALITWGILKKAEPNSDESVKLSDEFIEYINKRAGRNLARRHLSGIVTFAFLTTLFTFLATAVTMFTVDFIAAGAVTLTTLVSGAAFTGTSLASALSALSFLGLGFIGPFGPIVGTLIFAAILAAAAAVIYSVTVSIIALSTIPPILPNKELGIAADPISIETVHVKNQTINHLMQVVTHASQNGEPNRPPSESDHHHSPAPRSRRDSHVSDKPESTVIPGVVN